MVAGHLQEKKGYFYIVLSFKDDMGKYKTKWSSTGLPVKGNKKKAEAMLMEARKSFEISPSVTEEETTFVRFMESWLEMTRPNLELTTYAAYSSVIRVVVTPYFKGTLLCDLQPKHIQAFYTYCLNKRRVSATSVIRYHAVIRKALKYAVDTDIIPANPADKVQKPKQQKFVGKFYDVDEINDLFRVVKGTSMELPVMLAAFYGLRRSEVVGLKWDAIDFKRKTITICHTITTAVIDGKLITIEKERTKTKSSYRILPLVPEFDELLTRLKKQQNQNRSLCKKSYNKEYLEYICVDMMGDRIKPGYITRVFAQVLAKNNLRKIRFHDLRHSCASLLLANGVNMKQIQDWLGHSNFGTTANIYAHLDVNAKLNSANAMRTAGMNLIT